MKVQEQSRGCRWRGGARNCVCKGWWVAKTLHVWKWRGEVTRPRVYPAMCVLYWPSDHLMKHGNCQAQEFSLSRAGNLLSPTHLASCKLSININILSLRENKHCNLICILSKSNFSFRLLKCKRWACFHIRLFIQPTKVMEDLLEREFC